MVAFMRLVLVVRRRLTPVNARRAGVVVMMMMTMVVVIARAASRRRRRARHKSARLTVHRVVTFVYATVVVFFECRFVLHQATA
jgi:hypothetical protein